MNAEQIFTVSDVAKHLKVSNRTVYSLISKGDIPAVKIGGTRVRESDLQKYISSRMVFNNK
jgi:excisionase family DNA binding protein